MYTYCKAAQENRAGALSLDGRTMRIVDPATYAAMRDFGTQFDRAQATLRAFTPALIPVHRTRPFALDAQDRWLKTRQMAVYAVNRDLDHEAAVPAGPRAQFFDQDFAPID